MADAIFEDPRLAAVYDSLDPDRGDLDVYGAIVAELGARTVLDVGCGTGTFACLLADSGIGVVGVDPARASLDVARAEPGADAVHWLCGDATTLPSLVVDAALMTGNVAQVLVTDESWRRTLAGIAGALRPGGWLVFEVRDPGRRAWEGWTRAGTHRRVDVAGIRTVEAWEEVLDVRGELVMFRTTTVLPSGLVESTSTLRFRSSAGSRRRWPPPASRWSTSATPRIVRAASSCSSLVACQPCRSSRRHRISPSCCTPGRSGSAARRHPARCWPT
ncbi:MAG: class I SAM-dependent methyltransferase [Ilumatobacteraceae bacterium]